MIQSGYIQDLEHELVEASRRLHAGAGGRATRASRRRRGRLAPVVSALAAAGVVAAVVLALQSAGGGPPPAYAVTQAADGTVRLTLEEMIGVEPANEQLAKLGVPVLIRRVEADCSETGQIVRGEGSSPIPDMIEPVRSGSGLDGMSWAIHPAAIPQGDTLAITVQVDPDSTVPAVGAALGLFQGRAPRCSPPGMFG